MQASHASAKGPQPDISAYHVLIIHFLFVQKDTKRAQQVLEVRPVLLYAGVTVPCSPQCGYSNASNQEFDSHCC